MRLTSSPLPVPPDYVGSSYQRYLCPDLPATDVRGWSHGKHYVPFLGTRGSRLGVSPSIPGLKTGRTHECLSMLERRLHYLLELRSDVLDFREQYPFYDDASVAARIEQGIKIYRQEVCPIDVIVTLRCELTGGFKYQGLSVKYDSDLNRPNVWKKLLREREYCERLGWLWSLVTDRTLSNAASEAARKITGYCLRTEATPENVAAAYSIADVIRRRQGEKLDDAVTKSARRLGITRNDGYRLFGVACVLGIIRPDLEKGIGRDIPLCLHGDEE